MKNNEREIGDWLIIEPQLVVKLAMVFPKTCKNMKNDLWEDQEEIAKERLPSFRQEELFFEENFDHPKGELSYSFRYYTPLTNLMKNVRH